MGGRGEATSARPAWSGVAVARAAVAAVVAADLLAVLLVGLALRQSWHHHRARAEVATQNLAAVLGQSIGAAVDKIDLALLAVVDEHAHARAGGGDPRPALDDEMVRQLQRVPMLAGMLLFDAAGDLQGGTGIPPDVERISVADRAYFARLRDDPAAGLVISEPVIGKIRRKPELILARRLEAPGGGFAGAVLGILTIEDLDRVLGGLDVGPRGVIVLRGEDLGLIVRRQASGPRVALGDRTVSPELRTLVASGLAEATYTGVAVDGIERTFSYRRVTPHPLLVIVGASYDDWLAAWRREVAVAAAVLAAFTLATAAGVRFGLRSWRRREAAVEALAEQETRFRLLAESATDVIWMADAAGRLTWVSPAAERVLGWSAAELCALPLEALHTPASLARHRALVAQAAGAAPRAQPFAGVLLQQELRAKDGRLVEAEAHLALLWGPEGQAAGAIGVSRDVTERRQMQARVQLAERMASVGTLAAGVAHEVNNPLTYVLSNVGFALEQLQATKPAWAALPGCSPLREASQALREALGGADRVRHIMRELKTFSRVDGGRPGPVDLNGVVEACLRMTATATAARARVVRSLGDVPRVLASEARLGQVVLNLVTNAAQAIPEGQPAAHEIAVSTAAAADGRVELTVRDTGAGIPPEVLPRIFDPFFTTKPLGEGTGLGLSICHGIVRGLGGEIRVEPAPGCGTTFRVLLPAAPAAAAREAPAPGPAAPPARRRVLVVDDDPLVARAVARLAKAAGDVEVTVRPGEVAERVAAGERWDVVLCDLMMPEVS
ncbi:MAG TPA: ATP-binding protein, partial [Anaeromyxobacteraceae bacterium]|nr:ATP-binding protein [Anaeromyxobacteraceae bacterium]